MKKRALLILAFLAQVSLLVNAQIYIDPGRKVDAKAFTYKMSAAPTIDGSESEWANIPWTESRYNDRDWNSDGLFDPMTDRLDLRARWKSAWVEGSNKIYFLFEVYDDVIYVADSIDKSRRDGLELRMDPFYEQKAGEPMDDTSKNSFNIQFQMNDGVSRVFEGNEKAKPTYESKVVTTTTTYYTKTVFELAVTLPSNLTITKDYVMGFYLIFDDNDPEDDSPSQKNAVATVWPQCYSDMGNASEKNESGRLKPDTFWENDFWWGSLECIDPTIHQVVSGGSIQSAIDAAKEGDIIKIAAGKYTENLTISTPYIQLIGTMTSTDTTKLVPADNLKPVIKIADDDNAPGVVIQNIAFDGWTGADTGAAVVGNTGIEIGSAQAQVLGNYLTGFGAPITYSAAIDSLKAYACVFEDNTLYACKGGIKFNTPATIFRYNTIRENTGGYGVEVKGLLAGNSIDIAYNTVYNHHGECGVGYAGSGTFTIHHNWLYRSEQLYGAGDQTGDDGIENQDAGGSTDYIYNNTIVGWKSDGMQLGGSSKGSSNYFIRNNLIAYNKGKDFDIRTTGSYDIDYGIAYQNGSANLITTLGTHGIEADPQFTNEIEDDYTILSTSPAVDAGLTEPFGFKVMYYGKGVDIGAFETGTPVVSAVEKDKNTVPTRYALGQNYPNPFNPSTTINFSLTQRNKVVLNVYNAIGQKVATLANGEFGSGEYHVTFNASRLASGIYFYSLQVGDFKATKKMVLLK